MNKPEIYNQPARLPTDEEIRQQRADFIAEMNWRAAIETKAREMLTNGSMVVAKTDLGKLIIISKKS